MLGAYLHDIGRSPLLAGDPRDHNVLSGIVLAAEGLGACVEVARAMYGEVLERVLSAAASQDADVTIPRYHDTQETLCGVYSRRCITPIEGMLMAGHKAVLDLLQRVRTHVLEEDQFQDLLGADPFFNINTKEDYEEAKRRVAHLHPEGVHHG